MIVDLIFDHLQQRSIKMQFSDEVSNVKQSVPKRANRQNHALTEHRHGLR